MNFVDISPFLYDRDLFYKIMYETVMFYEFAGIQAIVGLDARGFIFGAYLAAKMNRPFVMIRKTGKLPPEFSKDYQYTKEYGSDTFSIPTDVIVPGTKCLLVDDVLATGGSLFAAAKLVESVGGVVQRMWVLTTIPELTETAKKTLEGYHVDSAV